MNLNMNMGMGAQDWAVAAIVAAAALYALWYWMPARLRRRLGKVRPALARTPGCGSCSSCSGCGSGPATSTEAASRGSTPATLDSAVGSPAPPPGAARSQPVWMRPER